MAIRKSSAVQSEPNVFNLPVGENAPAKKPRRTAAPKAQPGETAAARRARKSAPPLSPDERTRHIAEAAYYIAEQRGFAPGYEHEDWLRAEAEIDSRQAS